MKAFELYSAKDANDAVALLAKHSVTSKVRIIAGGTDLLADLKFSAAFSKRGRGHFARR